MKKGKITVVGSCNTDMVIKVHHLPAPGETIIGYDFMTNQGGKGANQAVAVARLGAQVAFIARVGDDAFGLQSKSLLEAESIDTRYVWFTPGVPTGVAMIPVDAKGENSIIVASGANALLSETDVDMAAEAIRDSEILLMQLETPIPTLIRAASIAHEAGVKVVLNPAPFPAEPLPAELLALVDLIIPNETETAGMTGITPDDEQSIRKAIDAIRNLGVDDVVMTAGGDGAYYICEDKLMHVPAAKTTVVDTTAAGDTFCGALCVALVGGNTMKQAMEFANRAAARSVARVGAWQSIPLLAELK